MKYLEFYKHLKDNETINHLNKYNVNITKIITEKSRSSNFHIQNFDKYCVYPFEIYSKFFVWFSKILNVSNCKEIKKTLNLILHELNFFIVKYNE
jgi:hypothetical protein